MEHRLGRTLRVFLIALASTGLYRLTMVPLIEYSAAAHVALEPTPEEAAAIRARAAGRLVGLGEIFPEGAWERDEPIVLESSRMRLLFKEYHSLPDGRVNLVPCTLVLLPEPAAQGEPPGRTMVVRAPQGAVLEFDEPIDLRQGRLAKLVGGNLRGEVTVRSTATSPTAEDELEILTRDLELAENRLQTIEAVQFRYGRSRGSGQGFVANLLSKPGAGDDRGPAVAGVESMRLERDVKLQLEGLVGGFLPGSDAAATPAADAGGATPVLVRCRGSLEFAVVSRLVTLSDHVDVSRSLPDGGTEQLSCDRLSILLAQEGGKLESDALDTDGLTPVELEARGSPVVARSTAGGLEARGERLGYEIATRRILLDGEQPVLLMSPDADLEARSVDYVPGPPGSPGSLMAVGPGWLESRGDASRGPVRVSWKKWLRVRPDGEGHVASVAGDAEAAVDGQGRLAAAEIHLWLEASAAPAPAQPLPTGGVSLAGVRPTRMLARGMVETDAEQLAARTDRLEIWFRHPEAAAGGQVSPASQPPRHTAGRAVPPTAGGQPQPNAAAASSSPGGAAGPAAAWPAGLQPIPVAAAAASMPPRSGPPAAAVSESIAAQQPRIRPRPDRGRIVAVGALMRALVDMRPTATEVAEISLEDSVRLIEEPRPGEGLPPLVIEGDQLQVARPTGFDARATVAGRPARIVGQGMELEGPLVEVDRGRNRMTVDGAGRMRLPIAGRSLGLDSLGMGSAAADPVSGAMAVAADPAAAAAAEKLEVTWQGRMDFDGLTARFIDRVVTATGEGRLEAGSLDVVLDRPFDFAAADGGGSAGRFDVARVACGSGVKIHNVSRTDDGSQSVERLYVRDLVIDRTTGNVAGTGPGRLENVRLGQAPGFEAPAGITGQPQPPLQPRPDELTYLAVDFQKGLQGNIGQRVLEFQQRVEAIFGPVASWDETLSPHDARGLPARTVRISTDVLGVGQTPPVPGQRRGSMEMYATGNVLVEGDTFTGRSARLSWSEAKDLIVFEGDGRSDAQLYRQERVGAPMSNASAGKIFYWRGLDRVDIHDARYLDLDQINANAAGFRPPGG
jgi:hypothetical protein